MSATVNDIPWIIYDDGGGNLAPLCDLRATFELRSGALTTLDRLTRQLGRPPAAAWVPPHFAALLSERRSPPLNTIPQEAADADAVLVVNGRWTSINAPLPTALNTALTDEHGQVAAARLSPYDAKAYLTAVTGADDDAPPLAKNGDTLRTEARPIHLLDRPWQLLQHAAANLVGDLPGISHLTPLNGSRLGVTVVGDHPVLVSPNAVVHPHVVFDTSAGPVAVDEGAEVRSMSVVVGPGYVGRGSIITNHAHVRAGTVVGPMCKVGGEVNGCLFQGYANKAHSGYLGNSFIGEWVNLGADTVTSNLKNTYGEVRMQTSPADPAEPTGMTHLGSIIGDHVKTAIGTRLLTGSCIHTGAMLATAGFPPKCIERFAFLTDAGVQHYDLAKFLEVADAVMRRRDIAVTEALRHRLEQLHSASDFLHHAAPKPRG